MISTPSSPEKPRKLLRWMDSSELEDLPRERPSTDNTTEGPGSDTTGLSKREDWYGAKMQRLKDNVEQLRKDLQGKERDNIRLKNKYNVSKRRQAQLQEDLQKYTEEKLDLDSDVEYLRLQLVEKDKQLSKHTGGHFENGETLGGHLGNAGNGGSFQNGGAVENYGIDDVEESYFTEDSILSRKYLNLHKETRKLFTYILLSVAICFSLIALLTRSAFLSTIVVGLWTLGLSCLWLERKQLFRVFKLKYLKKIREVSMENSRLRMEASKLASRFNELGNELTNEKRERDDLLSKFKAASGKLAEEMSKNEELVKLEKSTFEELQGERVRRRRAEEQLEEVSAQVLLAQEKDEVANCGDVCQELRNNLKLERESKEKLSRENERLIKEIVEMNMREEKERLKQESDQTFGARNELVDNKDEQISVEVIDQVAGKVDERNLRYTNEKMEEEDGQKLTREDNRRVNEETKNIGTEESKQKAMISNEDVNNFDSKECESMKNLSNTEAPTNLNNSQSIENSSQTANAAQNLTQGISSSNGQNSTESATKDCWLCAWNIPNETSLALLIIIVACLILMLKVVLSNNVYMFVILMALVGCFTYYQVARNIEHSN